MAHRTIASRSPKTELVDTALYNVVETCRLLRVSDTTLRRLVRDGILRRADWGGRWQRFTGAQIREAAERMSGKAEPEQGGQP